MPRAVVSSSWPASAARASGRSEMRGLGRAEVNTGAKRPQSTAATTTTVSSRSSTCWKPSMASAGRMKGMPRPRSCRSARLAAMPLPSCGAQMPHTTEVAASPRARRFSARPSR